MVTIGPITKTSPSVSFYVDAVLHDQSGNSSRVDVTVRCYGGPSSSASTSKYLGSGDHWGGIDGVGWVIQHHRDSNFLPAGYGPGALRWAETATTGYISHDVAGNLTLIIRLRIAYGTIGPEEYTGVLTLPRIAQVPAKPAKPVLISASTTDITYQYFNAPDNGGSIELTFDHQVATDPLFTTGVQGWQDGNSPTTTPPLAPGTQHYIRYASRNAVGLGPWSDTLTQTTLPAVAPGLSIVPQPSGETAKLLFTPPGGVTGVTRYAWERRLTGTTTPVTAGETTASTVAVAGLVPGSSYEWRGSAWIGLYQSPWTSWTPALQPKPNTSPGDYFDGSFLDTTDLDYAFTGTAGASSSTATGLGVAGWVATPSGGTATLSRVTAGLQGSYAARVTVVTDSTGIGGRFGQSPAAGFAADITPGGAYVGSLHAKLNRQNRVAAEISWLDASHAVLSRTAGSAVLQPAGAWVRLWVSGEAPVGAEFATVQLVDVVGTGSSTWRGGDVIDLDGAMISIGDLFPYFDGSSLDDDTYTYAWRGADNASESTRTPVPVAAVAPGSASLVDPDCAVVPLPPRPPIIANACIVETGVWRRSFGAIPATAISDWLAVVPTIEIVTKTQVVRQVRIRIYANPLALPSNQINTAAWVSEQIISYVPADTVLTLDGVSQRAWAAVSGGGTQAADHLLYGTGGTPASWPILSCGIAYVITADLPVDVPQGDARLFAYLTTRT